MSLLRRNRVSCSLQIGLLVTAVMFSAMGEARADPQSVIVTPTDVIGRLESWSGIPPSVRFRGEVTDGLTRAQIITRPELQLTRHEGACDQEDCLSKLAAKYHADVVVGSRVVRLSSEPPTYQITLWTFGAQLLENHYIASCSDCSLEVLADSVRNLAFEAGKKIVSLRAHAATASAPDHTKPATETGVSPDDLHSWQSTPGRPPTPTAPTPLSKPREQMVSRSGRTGLRAAAAATFSLGLGSLIGGIVETMRDGRACTPSPPATDCPERRDTTNGQALFYSLASGSIVAAAVLTYYGFRPRQNRRSLVVVPTAGVGSVKLDIVMVF